MHQFLLAVHNIVRWVVLILGVIVVFARPDRLVWQA